MRLNLKSVFRDITSSVFFAVLLAFPVDSMGALGQWPNEIRNPLFVFSAQWDLGATLVNLEGLKPDPLEDSKVESYRTYKYLVPDPKWEGKIPCGKRVLDTAVVSTSPVASRKDEKAAIAFPVKFHFEGKLTSKKKEEFLKGRLFQISFIDYRTEDMEPYAVVPDQEIPVSSFYREPKHKAEEKKEHEPKDEKEASEEDVRIVFDSVFVGKQFDLPKDKEFRIRIEWNPNAICDDKKSDFALGDQIRVIRVKN